VIGTEAAFFGLMRKLVLLSSLALMPPASGRLFSFRSLPLFDIHAPTDD